MNESYINVPGPGEIGAYTLETTIKSECNTTCAFFMCVEDITDSIWAMPEEFDFIKDIQDQNPTWIFSVVIEINVENRNSRMEVIPQLRNLLETTKKVAEYFNAVVATPETLVEVLQGNSMSIEEMLSYAKSYETVIGILLTISSNYPIGNAKGEA